MSSHTTLTSAGLGALMVNGFPEGFPDPVDRIRQLSDCAAKALASRRKSECMRIFAVFARSLRARPSCFPACPGRVSNTRAVEITRHISVLSAVGSFDFHVEGAEAKAPVLLVSNILFDGEALPVQGRDHFGGHLEARREQPLLLHRRSLHCNDAANLELRARHTGMRQEQGAAVARDPIPSALCPPRLVEGDDALAEADDVVEAEFRLEHVVEIDVSEAPVGNDGDRRDQVRQKALEAADKRVLLRVALVRQLLGRHCFQKQRGRAPVARDEVEGDPNDTRHPHGGPGPERRSLPRACQ